MEHRRPYIALVGLIYAAAHYAATVSHVADEFGLQPLSGVAATGLKLLFGISVVAIAVHVAPALLKANICVSNAALAGLSRANGLIDQAMEGARKACIFMTERLLAWLKSPNWDTGSGSEQDEPPDR